MTISLKLLRCFAACLLFLGGGLSQSTAQTLLPTATEAAEQTNVAAPSPNDVKELVRLLEDERIRAWLEKAADGAEEGASETSQSVSEGLKFQLSAALDRTRQRAVLIQGVWQNISRHR